MKKISVIVPIYKVEKYLKRCVDSILNQTYKNIELILVDDGSPDRCPEICDDYARKDKRVRVFHKENSGVSAARNVGLDNAIGDYIAFVDSDDYIESDMYEKMMNKAEEYDCEFVMCDCVKDSEASSELYTHGIRAGYYSHEQLEKEIYPNLLVSDKLDYPAVISNWLFLFKNNSNVPRYVEGVRYCEDLLFGAQLMYTVKSFYYMKGEAFYHYCFRDDSACVICDYSEWKDFITLHNEAEKCFLNNDVKFNFKNQVDLLMLLLLVLALNDLSKDRTIQKFEKIRIAKEFLDTDKVKKMMKKIKIRKLRALPAMKVYIFCYKYKLGLRFIF